MVCVYFFILFLKKFLQTCQASLILCKVLHILTLILHFINAMDNWDFFIYLFLKSHSHPFSSSYCLYKTVIFSDERS